MNPSAFAQHLGTNYSPSEEEVVQIKAVIQDHTQAADAVAEEIEALERELSIKRDVYAAHKRSVEEHKALLSPIRRIPPDILSTIFLDYLPDAAISWRHPAVTASHVSRAWRQFALDLTVWWSKIKVELHHALVSGNGDVYPEWIRRVRMVTRLYKVWAERSGQSPLTLTMEVQGRDEIDERHAETVERNLRELVNVVCETSTRWQVVDLMLHFSGCTRSLARLFDLPCERVPILRHLDVAAMCSGLPMESPFLRTLEHIPSTMGVFTTPSLRTLCLRGEWGCLSPSDIPKNWSTLTSAHLSVWSRRRRQVLDPAVLLHYLKQTPILQSLSFDLYPPFSDGNSIPLQPIPIHLAYLTRLHIHVEVHPTPRGFAQHVSLPALQTLCVQFRCNDEHYLVSRSDELVELIRKVGKTLKTLSLPLDVFERPAVVAILSCLPHLEELTSNTDILSYRLVDASVIGPDCCTLTELNEGEECTRCPSLRRLSMAVQGSYADSSIEDAILKLLLRRCGKPTVQTCSRIQKLRVQFAHKKSEEGLDVLQELQRHGVDLEDTVVQLEYSKY